MFALVYYQKKRAEVGGSESEKCCLICFRVQGERERGRGLAPQHNLLNINDLKSSINSISSFFHNDPNKTNTRPGHKGKKHGELTRPAASNCNWRFVTDTRVNSYRHTFDISEATAESVRGQWRSITVSGAASQGFRFSTLGSLPASRVRDRFSWVLHNSCFCHSFHHKPQRPEGEWNGAKYFIDKENKKYAHKFISLLNN